MMMLEVFVALILTGVVLSATVPLMLAVDRSRRMTEQRRIAALELSNWMEQLATQPVAALTDQTLKELTLSASTRAALPEARLESHSEPVTDLPGVVRVKLALHWKNSAGIEGEPARLTAWLGGAAK